MKMNKKLKNKFVKMYCIIDNFVEKFTYIHWAQRKLNVTACLIQYQAIGMYG